MHIVAGRATGSIETRYELNLVLDFTEVLRLMRIMDYGLQSNNPAEQQMADLIRTFLTAAAKPAFPGKES